MYRCNLVEIEAFLLSGSSTPLQPENCLKCFCKSGNHPFCFLITVVENTSEKLLRSFNVLFIMCSQYVYSIPVWLPLPFYNAGALITSWNRTYQLVTSQNDSTCVPLQPCSLNGEHRDKYSVTLVCNNKYPSYLQEEWAQTRIWIEARFPMHLQLRAAGNEDTNCLRSVLKLT